jgi:hypothetical protein
VTIQTIPFASDALMLLTAAALLALAGAGLVQLARRRGRAAAWLACTAATVVAVYGAVDLGVGLSSRPLALAPGDSKCFDDWCASMTGAREDVGAGTLLVGVRLQNRARGRAMRADLAHAYLELPGGRRVAPRDGRSLLAFLQPGQVADVTLTFPAPAGVRDVRFIVAEGDGGFGPGAFEIGGEGSPFHARTGWPLAGVTSS